MGVFGLEIEFKALGIHHHGVRPTQHVAEDPGPVHDGPAPDVRRLLQHRPEVVIEPERPDPAARRGVAEERPAAARR